MKCIVFVNRIVTARSLSYILRNLKFLSSWKCHFLVGVHSGLKSMSRKTTNNILKKFRSGEVMLHTSQGVLLNNFKLDGLLNHFLSAFFLLSFRLVNVENR